MNKNKIIKICLVAILTVICFSSDTIYASEVTGTVSSTSASSGSQTGGTVGGASGGNNSAGSTVTGSVGGNSIGGTVTTGGGGGGGGSTIGGTVATPSGGNNMNISNTSNIGYNGTGGPGPEVLPTQGRVLGATDVDTHAGSQIALATNDANVAPPLTASISQAFGNFSMEFWFWIILLSLLLIAVIYYIYAEYKEEKSMNV